jgi:tyrosine-protein phosphatase SIW14
LIAGGVGGVALSRLALWGFHLKRFAVVEEGALYRCAQPTERGLGLLVRRYGVKTVACLRRENAQLRHSVLDLDDPSGAVEGEAVAALGARPLHWPMGGEAYWPWFGPQQFEDFFELMDDPANFPVAVHCIGGRHRTGTFVALYRIEYQRWTAEDALREMLSFEFGEPVPVQEHNLRTYLPRARPGPVEWAALNTALAGVLDQPGDYATFIRQLRQARLQPAVARAIDAYVRTAQPFSLCLAQRLIDQPSDGLATIACGQAAACLRDLEASPQDWAIAASLVADFGEPQQQRELLELLTSEPRSSAPTPRYQAIVCGVTNRYSDNRLAFLRPILDDERPRGEPDAVHQVGGRVQPYRYCDTAVARLCAIVDRYGVIGPSAWEQSRRQFCQWFADHPEACRPCRLGECRLDLPREPATSSRDQDDYR